MNRKLLLFTFLSLVPLLAAYALYQGPWQMRDPALCEALGHGIQEQVECDGFLNAGIVFVATAPLAGCVFLWTLILGSKFLTSWERWGKPWIVDPAHYAIAKGCQACESKPMRVTWMTLALFAMACGLFTFLPTTASALGGTPATLGCTLAFNAPTGQTLDPHTPPVLVTDSQGFAYVSYEQHFTTPVPKIVGVIEKISQTCSVIWSASPTNEDCSGTNSECIYEGGLHIDIGGRVASNEFYCCSSTTGTHSYGVVLNATNGHVLSRSADFKAIVPAAILDRGITSIPNGTTDLNYFAADLTDGLFYKLNSNLSTRLVTHALSGADFPWCCDTSDQSWFAITVTTGGGGEAAKKIDSATGDTLLTTSGTWTQGSGAGEHIELAFTNTTRLYGLFSSGGANSTISYVKINKTDFTSTNVAPANNRIDEGGGPSTSGAIDFDLAGDDSFLGCGVYLSNSIEKGWIARFLTSNDTQDWNITHTAGDAGGYYEMRACKFDYASGFYTIGAYSNSGRNSFEIQHYSGGGFTQPTFRNGQLIVPPAAPVNPGTVDAGQAVANLATGTGFGSSSGKFLFGIFLLVLFMTLAGALFKNIGNSKIATGGVIIVGLSEGFFNTIIGLWDPIYTVLVILVGGAIVTFVVRRMFQGQSGGGEGGG